MEIEIFRLNIAAPLFYTPVDGADPFNYRKGTEDTRSGEKIFCFELNEAERVKIEPDRTKLLGTLIFAGKSAAAAPGKGETPGELSWELPKGKYLFTQKREILSREDIITLAVEIQQEGLWQRLKPGKRLCLRYLFEDGSLVTQLFRPFSD